MPRMFAVILQEVTQKWTNDSDLKKAGAAVPLGAGIVELCSVGVWPNLPGVPICFAAFAAQCPSGGAFFLRTVKPECARNSYETWRASLVRRKCPQRGLPAPI